MFLLTIWTRSDCLSRLN